MRRACIPLVISISVLLTGCPLRPNPLYFEDADIGDSRDDADDTIEADLDQHVDGDDERPDVVDNDEPDPCGTDEMLCDEGCVSILEEDNCGACGRVCDSDPACSCTGVLPQCAYPGGRACYATCGPDDLQCGDECIAQPDDDHCGSCDEHCSPGAGCECRLSSEGGEYDCMRMDGEEWVSC